MILNLTQHPATPEQIKAGVVDVPSEQRPRLTALLTFPAKDLADNPSAAYQFIESRARSLVSEFVLPELMSRASALLAEGGYTAFGPEALTLLRPGTVTVEVMIGGASFFAAPLERALLDVGAQPLYALSERESVEEVLPDGTVKKIGVFRHLGFLAVPTNKG